MNIFEQATRSKFRYPSKVGFISTEDLWALPLTSAKGASLDDTAKSISRELRNHEEESFVETTSNPAKAELLFKLDIVKHVIAVKQSENEAARGALAKKAEREKILNILAEKQDESLKNLSEEELLARVNSL